jgi:hypothetical protein
MHALNDNGGFDLTRKLMGTERLLCPVLLAAQSATRLMWAKEAKHDADVFLAQARRDLADAERYHAAAAKELTEAEAERGYAVMLRALSRIPRKGPVQ